MTLDQVASRMENAINSFHGNFKKMYGQLSARVDDASYLTTGGNKIISDITRDDFELCDMESGELGAIFKARPDINAIIFGISADTVEASSDTGNVKTYLEDLAMICGPELNVISNTEPETILSALTDTNVCLIKGIGALSTGSNFKKAVAGMLLVEKNCEALNHGRMLGGAIPLNEEEALAYKQSFREDYTTRNEEEYVDFVGFDEEEFAGRCELIDYGHALVNNDLSYGSWGNISIRLNEDEMLITPSAMDYFEIKPEDIVKVNIHTLEYGNQRVPSSEAPMHAAIYRTRDDADAVIHTHSNGISVFAACEKGFAITDPTLKDLIGDIVVTESAPPGSDKLGEVVSETMQNTHACIIPHHGAVFYGPSLEVVFAIAEAVEQKARNLLAFDSIDSFEDVLDD